MYGKPLAIQITDNSKSVLRIDMEYLRGALYMVYQFISMIGDRSYHIVELF